MKKCILFLLSLGLITSGFKAFGQKSYSSKEVLKECENFFTIEQQEGYISVNVVDSLSADHFMGSFYNENQGLLNFIFTHYGKLNYDRLSEIAKTEADPISFIKEELKREEVFYKYLLALYNNYLKRTGGKITDLLPLKKVTITADSLFLISSKFFYLVPLQLTEGEYYFKVCIACIDCEIKPENEMLPLIQGFSFLAIQTSKEEGFWNDFRKMYKEIPEINTEKSMSIEERSIYLNKIIYSRMSQSESLRKVLLEKYEELKDILDFEIVER